MPIRPEMKTKYPPDWREISLRIRVERALNRCECMGECGHDHEAEWDAEGEESRWIYQNELEMPQSIRCLAINRCLHPITDSDVVLTVAHLDHDPTNNADDNLKAMCQRCHLAYDREEHARTRRARKALGDLFDEVETT